MKAQNGEGPFPPNKKQTPRVLHRWQNKLSRYLPAQEGSWVLASELFCGKAPGCARGSAGAAVRRCHVSLQGTQYQVASKEV